MTDLEKLVEKEAVVITISGLDIIMDADDYERLKTFGFAISHANMKKKHPYVIIRRNNRSIGGPSYMRLHEKYRLHRVIMDAKPGQVVDHINGNTRDNRRCNLRFVDPMTNARNIRVFHVEKTSKYLGVSRNKRGKWVAQLCIDGKQTCLGTFASEDEAAAVRDLKVIELYPGAALNFPLDAINAIKRSVKAEAELAQLMAGIEEKV